MKRYRDARGRFTKRPSVRKQVRVRRRRQFSPEEESILDDVRKSYRGERVLPAGTEFELTATTHGGSPKKRGKR